jgi:hypothetical protein
LLLQHRHARTVLSGHIEISLPVPNMCGEEAGCLSSCGLDSFEAYLSLVALKRTFLFCLGCSSLPFLSLLLPYCGPSSHKGVTWNSGLSSVLACAESRLQRVVRRGYLSQYVVAPWNAVISMCHAPYTMLLRISSGVYFALPKGLSPSRPTVSCWGTSRFALASDAGGQ